ncbi:hypothetical protein MKK58_16335 [Methylobacterium sp. J-078]|uniref:hypothetical protein n=1 Tax=Methylobacterium sp. J-078 TaxID=2836657 RepID=UPI001FB8FFB8|nr:hypothetical protein [Methylobacterium sp. J-078]MCJ2046083.1 hypothetical protein [Methylobacterium sp. J-078]
MPRTLPARRIPRHHLSVRRRPARGRRVPGPPAPVRLSDLILGLLGVTLLGGLALMASAALIGRALTLDGALAP